MIYLFTGNSRYLVQAELTKWKLGFQEKFGENEITHIKNNVPASEIISLIHARSFFSEKRLIVIENFPASSEAPGLSTSDEEKIIASLTAVPDENIVVFSSYSPDKRKTQYKSLTKIAEVKEFMSGDENNSFSRLEQKYSSNIDANALKKLIYLTGNDVERCISEIEKLQILKEKIQIQDIEKHVSPNFEESIFVCIDTLLDKNSHKFLSEFRNIIGNTSYYAFYQSFIVNLRVFLYIIYLKKQRKKSGEITDILSLGKRSFLINKNIKANFLNIQELYTNLLSLDKSMKTGKLTSSDEKDLVKNMEQCFLKYFS